MRGFASVTGPRWTKLSGLTLRPDRFRRFLGATQFSDRLGSEVSVSHAVMRMKRALFEVHGNREEIKLATELHSWFHYVSFDLVGVLCCK